MSEISARLSLPFLLPAQAQKHVTHNEALLRLDQITQLTVIAFGATTPPAQANEGEIWALGAAPSGLWAGHPGTLAAWADGAWHFITPGAGWRAAQGADLRVFDGADWIAPGMPDLQNLDSVGINATADTTNRLSLSSEASLLSHDGAGHQLKINKASAPETASLLFQSNWSGRAEMGLAGNDDFSIKVSADGTSWQDAITIDGDTGAVACPAGMQIDASVTGTAVQQDSDDATPGRLLLTGAFGLGSGTIPIDNSWNDPKATGWYRDSTSSATGKPFAGAVRGHLMSIRGWDDAYTQIAAERDNGRLYTRSAGTNGVPTDWFEFATTRDFVHNSVEVEDLDDATTNGIYQFDSAASNIPFASFGVCLVVNRGVALTQFAMRQNTGNADLLHMRIRFGSTWSPWQEMLHTANTTVDSNGFIKEASPIVRLFDSHIEEPVQPVGAVFTREGHGQYVLRNVPPLATRGWQIEIPQDENGTRLVHIATRHNPGNRIMTVQTTQPVWSMQSMSWQAGEPVDIPRGRWVDLRFAQDSPKQDEG